MSDASSSSDTKLWPKPGWCQHFLGAYEPKCAKGMDWRQMAGHGIWWQLPDRLPCRKNGKTTERCLSMCPLFERVQDQIEAAKGPKLRPSYQEMFAEYPALQDLWDELKLLDKPSFRQAKCPVCGFDMLVSAKPGKLIKFQCLNKCYLHRTRTEVLQARELLRAVYTQNINEKYE